MTGTEAGPTDAMVGPASPSFRRGDVTPSYDGAASLRRWSLTLAVNGT